jgi:hypothetical protein
MSYRELSSKHNLVWKFSHFSFYIDSTPAPAISFAMHAMMVNHAGRMVENEFLFKGSEIPSLTKVCTQRAYDALCWQLASTVLQAPACTYQMDGGTCYGTLSSCNASNQYTHFLNFSVGVDEENRQLSNEFFHDKRSHFQRHFPSVTYGPVAVLSEPVKL